MVVTRKGIDVSKWNVITDAKLARQSGVEFAILREGHGFNTDISFFDNVKKFRAAGIDVAGVYHFAYATTCEGAAKEAKLCLDNLKQAKLESKPGFIVFYDFEYDTINECKKVGVTLTKKECNEFTKVFCETIEAAGYTAGIYFNLDFYRNWYDHDLLSQYANWYADWRASATPLEGCVYHQYSSIGSVPGIVGHVDMNNCYFLKGVEPPEHRDSLVDEIVKGVLKPLIAAGHEQTIRNILDELSQNDSI